MIVDSHCHVAAHWYEPVESLLYQMDQHSVARAILVQMLGQTDNAYQQDCVRRYPDRFLSVVLVDTGDEAACAKLRALAASGASGVRLRPSARSPGPDPLAIWRTAQACGLAVSCVGNSAAFAAPEFAALIEALPGLKIVLEHLGGSSQPDANDAERARRQQVFGLARYPYLALKLPGLGELAPRVAPASTDTSPFEPLLPNVLAGALKAFGPSRLMWGSDYPPVSSREGYGNALRWPRAALADLPAAERDAIFGGNALTYFAATVPA